MPVWATLIALMVDDEVVAVGGLGAPRSAAAGGRRRAAAPGPASPCSRRPAARSPTYAALEDASLSYSSLHGWDERGRLEDFISLTRRCWRTRAYGDFWSYMLVAEGAVDIAAEPELAALRHGGAST